MLRSESLPTRAEDPSHRPNAPLPRRFCVQPLRFPSTIHIHPSLRRGLLLLALLLAFGATWSCDPSIGPDGFLNVLDGATESSKESTPTDAAPLDFSEPTTNTEPLPENSLPENSLPENSLPENSLPENSLPKNPRKMKRLLISIPPSQTPNRPKQSLRWPPNHGPKAQPNRSHPKKQPPPNAPPNHAPNPLRPILSVETVKSKASKGLVCASAIVQVPTNPSQGIVPALLISNAAFPQAPTLFATPTRNPNPTSESPNLRASTDAPQA